MRRIRAIKDVNGGLRPDVPAGTNFPPNDDNIEGVDCDGEHYVIYETGDELPEGLKPGLRILSDLSGLPSVWRYMDFAKFMAWVQEGAVFFTPAYILRESEPYELRIPLRSQRQHREAIEQSFASEVPLDGAALRRWRQLESEAEDMHVLSLALSCWHIGEHESNALWKAFVRAPEGVAVKSDVARMGRALNCRRRNISVDAVQYIDYIDGDFVGNPNARGFEPIFHKSRFYEYERELRLALHIHGSFAEVRPNPAKMAELDPQQRTMARRFLERRHRELMAECSVQADLRELIEEVVVSPFAGEWFARLVTRYVRETLGDGVRVRWSNALRFPSI